MTTQPVTEPTVVVVGRDVYIPSAREIAREIFDVYVEIPATSVVGDDGGEFVAVRALVKTPSWGGALAVSLHGDSMIESNADRPDLIELAERAILDLYPEAALS